MSASFWADTTSNGSAIIRAGAVASKTTSHSRAVAHNSGRKSTAAIQASARVSKTTASSRAWPLATNASKTTAASHAVASNSNIGASSSLATKVSKTKAASQAVASSSNIGASSAAGGSNLASTSQTAATAEKEKQLLFSAERVIKACFKEHEPGTALQSAVIKAWLSNNYPGRYPPSKKATKICRWKKTVHDCLSACKWFQHTKDGYVWLRDEEHAADQRTYAVRVQQAKAQALQETLQGTRKSFIWDASVCDHPALTAIASSHAHEDEQVSGKEAYVCIFFSRSLLQDATAEEDASFARAVADLSRSNPAMAAYFSARDARRSAKAELYKNGFDFLHTKQIEAMESSAQERRVRICEFEEEADFRSAIALAPSKPLRELGDQMKVSDASRGHGQRRHTLT